MANFIELMQNVVNLDIEEKVKLGKEFFSKTKDLCIQKGLKEKEVGLFIKDLLHLFAMADNKVNDKEYELICKIVEEDIDRNIFKKPFDDLEFEEELKKNIEGLSPKEKSSIFFLGVIILSFDDSITYEEIELIDNLFGQ